MRNLPAGRQSSNEKVDGPKPLGFILVLPTAVPVGRLRRKDT